MNRCDLRTPPAWMRLLSLLVLSAACVAAWGQNLVQRTFPADALRGTLVVVQPPEARVNGQPARLAPASRIRGENNLIVMSASLVGRELTVNYTVDSLGLVKDVWILRSDEARKTWPTTRREAATWLFDPVANAWAKR